VGADLGVGQVQGGAPRRPEQAPSADGDAAHLAQGHVDPAGYLAPAGERHLGGHEEAGGVERGADFGRTSVIGALDHLRVSVDGHLADVQAPQDAGVAQGDAAADLRPVSCRVIGQEHAALDGRVLEVDGRPARRGQAGPGEVDRAADAGAEQPDLAARRELVEEPDGAADVDAVGPDRAVTLAVDGGAGPEHPAADLRVAQPDRGPPVRGRVRPVRSGDVRPGQVKVAAQAQPVAQQARQPRGAGQRKLEELRALQDGRRVEVARLEAERERHDQPGEIEAPGHDRVGQPQPARIDLVAELTAAPAQHGGVDRPPDAAGQPVDRGPALARAGQLALVDLARGHVERPGPWVPFTG
jgi:hypothetical protein